MKVQTEIIIASEKAMKELVNSEIPIDISFNIANIMDDVLKVINVYRAQELKLYKKYGEMKKDTPTSEEGWFVPFNHPKIDEFNEEIKKLSKVEVDLKIEKIPLKELGLIKIKPLSLKLLLSWLIEGQPS
ncbi:MAG TPA: hypothetical protein VI815_03025 [Candidatus Nanoarchaeia archaeon]|nr:hypothetical protein [Candidatus Nanoarchaeia archaeon]